jgi:3-deoxy-D-manno-octulosonic acid kinase
MAEGVPATARVTVHPAPGTTLVAHPDILEPLTQVLQSGTLYAWAAAHPLRDARLGRAPTYVVPLSATVTGVVRHAWHGGVLAPLTRDRWRTPGRAPREAAISDRLRALGIPTPEVLAWATYGAGPGLVRVDVCTRLVPQARDFVDLFTTGDAERAQLAARALGPLMLRLAAARAHHADLNIKNVLLDAHAAAVVLDVDRVTFTAIPPADVLERNWARLMRSAAKWARVLGDAVPLAALAAVRDDTRATLTVRQQVPEALAS